MRVKFKTLATRVVAVAVPASVIVGCGSGSGITSPAVSPTGYVTAMCSAVTQLKNDGSSQLKLFSERVSGVHSVAQDKAATETYVSDLALAANRTVGRIKAAGSPNVTGGKSISSSFLSGYIALAHTLSLTADQTRSLPTNNLRAFQTATYKLGSNLQSAMQVINAGITGLRNTALDAFEPKVRACVALR
jgi:hypothetical protein